MKVGLVIYGSLDTLSGGYLYDRKLVEYLRSQGDTVEIISQPWQNYTRRLGTNFQPHWQQEMNSLDIDVLIQDELNHASLFLVNRAIRSRISFPIVAIVHHLRSSEEHPYLLRGFYKWVEHRYLHSVDGFIWNSQTTRQVVESMVGKAAAGVVAYPAGNRFGGMDENQILARLQNPGPLRLLFIGNLIRRKGLHTLISALGLLKNESWTLRVVGQEDVDSLYNRQISRQVEEVGLGKRIRFLGKLPEKSLADELQSANLLVMVSGYEGFGIVYLEGMSFGLPAIGSTAGAASEIIQDGKNGGLVAPEQPAELANVIRQYLYGSDLLKKHSLAARRRFLEFPTWEMSAIKIRQFLVDFLGSNWRRKK